MNTMNADRRRQEIAVFRYGVISDFLNGRDLSREEKKRLIEEKCARRWQIPYSQKTGIGVGTLYKWIRDYQASGNRLESLMPKERSDRRRSRAMDEETCASLMQLRREHPTITVRELMNRMIQLNRVTPGVHMTPTTVYRFLKHNGAIVRSGHLEDRRKFEAELPNDLWQSDVMHGPHVQVDDRKRKTYLIALIDDHSRLIPYARFYLSEALDSYLDALYHALARRGLPRKLYVDNGAAFRSHKLHYITASLNIALIHARPYKPQGKGKIERFFKTVRGMYLSGDSSRTLDELNGSFSQWLESYHNRTHASTGETPFGRFSADLSFIRPAPADLRRHFRTAVRRKVNRDRTVVINGRLFEAPVALIGKRIDLLYHDSAPDIVEAICNGRSYGFITKVSVHVNCRVKRDKNNHADMQVETPSSYSGGQLFGPNRKEKRS